jgi:tRNA threonylcarbamoyladenosine biosynthesis protein TsaE
MTAPATRPVVLTVADPAAMQALGARLASEAAAGDVLCPGDLGAGKTSWRRGFGRGRRRRLGQLPSFVLMAEYAGRLPLFHVDLYRLADGVDGPDGLDDRQAAGVTLVRPSARVGPSPSRLDVHRRHRRRPADGHVAANADDRHARYVRALR